MRRSTEARLVTDIATNLDIPVLAVASAADRPPALLMRPISAAACASDVGIAPYAAAYDVAFVIADGLSARAVQMHATPLLAAMLPLLREDRDPGGWRIAPLVIVRHGRVAIGDAVAAALGAVCVAILIGERPGLTAPDSMGAYLTWRPGPHTTDADRN